MTGIFGLPRSGTSWVGSIFDSHPRVLYRHEPDWFFKKGNNPYNDVFDAVKTIDEKSARHFVDLMLSSNKLRSIKLPLFRKSYLSIDRFALRLLIFYFLKGVERIPLINKLEIGSFPVPDLVNSQKKDITEVFKSVHAGVKLPLFAKLFPNDFFIYIIRHPCGFISSRVRAYKLGLTSKTTMRPQLGGLLKSKLALQKNWTPELIDKMSVTEKLACIWVLKNELVLSNLETLNNVKIVIYDELCQNPKQITKDLFNFTNLEWNQQTESYIDDCLNNNFVSTNKSSKANYYRVNKNPLITSQKWKKELDDSEIEKVMKITSGSRAMNQFD